MENLFLTPLRANILFIYIYILIYLYKLNYINLYKYINYIKLY